MDPVNTVPIGALLLGAAGAMVIAARFNRLTLRQIGLRVLVFGLSAAALLLGWTFYLRPRYGRATEVIGLVYLSDPLTPRLFVFHKGPRTSWTTSRRVSLLDARTGSELSREVAGWDARSARRTEVKAEAISPGKIWFRDDEHGLHARDAVTGSVLVTEAEILKMHPELRGAKAAEARSSDGTLFRVAPPAFRLELLSIPQPPVPAPDPYTFGLVVQGGVVIEDALHGLSLRNQDPQDPTVLKLMHLAKERGGFAPDVCLNPALDLREGFLVEKTGLEHPRSLLVGHREYDAARTKKFMLARIGFDGRVLWDLPEETFGGEPNHFLVRGETLYASSKGVLTAVDTAQGRVRWQVSF